MASPRGANFADLRARRTIRFRCSASKVIALAAESAPAPEDRKIFNAQRRALDALGLEADAKRADIKTRFKMLVKRHHPDANGGDRGSEARLREIIQAYNYLKVGGFLLILGPFSRPLSGLLSARAFLLNLARHPNAGESLLAPRICPRARRFNESRN